jgi:hypothetical protein
LICYQKVIYVIYANPQQNALKLDSAKIKRKGKRRRKRKTKDELAVKKGVFPVPKLKRRQLGLCQLSLSFSATFGIAAAS